MSHNLRAPSHGSFRCVLDFQDAGHSLLDVPARSLTEAYRATLCYETDALSIGLEPVTSAVLETAIGFKIVARPGVGHENVDVDGGTAAGVFTPDTQRLVTGDFLSKVRRRSIFINTSRGGIVDEYYHGKGIKLLDGAAV